MADLITLQHTQAALGDLASSDAARLPTLITAASRLIEQWTGRRFESLTVDEITTPMSDGRIYTRHRPILAIDRIAVDAEPLIHVWNTGSAQAFVRTVDSGDPFVSKPATGIELVRIVAGARVSTTLTFASYPTLTQLVAAINAVGNGWAATVDASYGDWASTELVPTGSKRADGGSRVGIKGFVTEVDDYQSDLEEGTIFTEHCWGQHRIRYTAGYSSPPADLQEACVSVVSWLLSSPYLAGSIKVEELGEYRVEADPITAGFPESAKRIIALHRSYVR